MLILIKLIKIIREYQNVITDNYVYNCIIVVFNYIEGDIKGTPGIELIEDAFIGDETYDPDSELYRDLTMVTQDLTLS